MAVDNRWVGAVLRQTRELAGVTREEMAAACRVSPGSISHWESGRVLPNAAQMGAWARKTDVPVDVLYREAGLMEEASEDAPAQIATVRDWWRARRAALGTHTTTRRGWHGAAKEGEMPGKPRDRDLHTAYKVGQIPAFAQALAAY